MSNLKKIIVMFIAVLALTGCSMKAEYNMEIREDKSMDFSIIMAMDDELIEGMLSMENMEMTTDDEETTEESTDEEETKEYTEEEKWAFVESSFEESSEEENDEKTPEELGFKKEKYEVDDYKGFKFVKTIKNIDDISGDKTNFELENFEEISDKVVFVKKGNKYKANFVLENENEESASGAEVMFDIKFVVTLPEKPISNNADKVSEDGKTLTWNLIDEQQQNIEFEFELAEDNAILIMSIVVFAIGVIAVIIVISKNLKSTKKNTNQSSNEQIETI